MTQIVFMPLPMTFDQDEIDAGRFRALDMYSSARTDAERVKALFWFHHWRRLNLAAAVTSTINTKLRER